MRMATVSTDGFRKWPTSDAATAKGSRIAQIREAALVIKFQNIGQITFGKGHSNALGRMPKTRPLTTAFWVDRERP